MYICLDLDEVALREADELLTGTFRCPLLRGPPILSLI